MTDEPQSPPSLSRDDARLIARQILRELSENLFEYVGRNVVMAAFKALAMLAFALALLWVSHSFSLPVADRPASH